MSDAVLERLRLVVLDNRRTGDFEPRQRPKKIFVDPGGRIRIGDAPSQGEGDGLGLSEVHQAVFATPPG